MAYQKIIPVPGISIVRIVVVCAATYYRKVIDEKGNPVANTVSQQMAANTPIK